MTHSSSYFARLIAEVACLLADPEIACDPRGALAGVAMRDLVRCYQAACARERQCEERYRLGFAALSGPSGRADRGAAL